VSPVYSSQLSSPQVYHLDSKGPDQSPAQLLLVSACEEYGATSGGRHGLK